LEKYGKYLSRFHFLSTVQFSFLNLKQINEVVELGFTAPQHCIGYMAPFRKKLVGSTSHLHRDKNMGYGSNKANK